MKGGGGAVMFYEQTYSIVLQPPSFETNRQAKEKCLKELNTKLKMPLQKCERSLC